MTIIRVQKDKNNPYVILNKSFLEDSSISLKLKGFLAYCLSKPDDWKFHVRQLATVLKEGKDSLYSALNEGVANGYIEKEEIRRKGRFFSFNYVIHETKIKIKSTVSGNPDAEITNSESQTLLSKDILNTDSNLYKSPIVPKGDSVRSRKKIQEEKKEVAPRVFISPSQHDSLLKEAKGNEKLVEMWYQELSRWKIGKGMFGGANDYSAIHKWVIQAVKDKMLPGGVTKEEQIEKDALLAQEVQNRYPRLLNYITLGYNYIEFKAGTSYEQIKFGDASFKERVKNGLRKMSLDVSFLN